MLQRKGRPFIRSRGISELTPRQRQVLALVADGLSNPEIAERMCVTVKSAENYLNDLYKFYGTPSGDRVKLFIAINQDLELASIMGE